MRVLLIEDEATLAEHIAEGLRDEGMAVDVALDGAVGLEKAAINRYDVVVLDRDLPVVHGDAVCRSLVSSERPSRIIMLTASGGLEQRVEGLALGADDYLPKPFPFVELVARIRALARRPSSRHPPIFERTGIKLDTARHTASRDGFSLRLSKKEFAVLELLLAAGGGPVSAEDLLEQAWDENVDPFTNAVRVTMSRLREKLGDPPVIETVTGVGYRIP